MNNLSFNIPVLAEKDAALTPDLFAPFTSDIEYTNTLWQLLGVQSVSALFFFIASLDGMSGNLLYLG